MNPLAPAFPFMEMDDDGTPCRQWPGLSKREYFAALAMQGFLSRGDIGAKHAAIWAVERADALIAALNETQP